MSDVLTAPDEQITGSVVITGEEPVADDAPEQPAEAAAEEAGQQTEDDPYGFDAVLEEPKNDGPTEIDPNSPDYSHVDKQVQKGEVVKRIGQLTAEKHILARKAEALERQRDAAIAAANAMANRLKSMSGETHAVSRSAVTIAQEKTKSDVETAKRQYQEARANGDVEKETAAAEALNRAMMEHSKVSEVVLPDEPQTPEEVRYYEALQQQMLQQPVILPEPFLQWKESNPWYGNQNDPVAAHFTRLANDISTTIASEGIAVDSAEHFAELNSRLRATAPKIFGDPQPTRQTQQSTAVPKASPVRQPVAPIGTRTAPTARRTVPYTQEEKKWADEHGFDIRDIILGRQGVRT